MEKFSSIFHYSVTFCFVTFNLHSSLLFNFWKKVKIFLFVKNENSYFQSFPFFFEENLTPLVVRKLFSSLEKIGLKFVPLMVEYKINDKDNENKGYVRYYLAPKIEDAEAWECQWYVSDRYFLYHNQSLHNISLFFFVRSLINANHVLDLIL